MKLVKNTNRLFYQLPKDLEDLIFEFARDDSKKKKFIKSFEQMHTVWNLFYTNLPSQKYVEVIDLKHMIFSVKNKSKKDYYTHFITLVGMIIHCDECFKIKPSFPSHLILDYSIEEW